MKPSHSAHPSIRLFLLWVLVAAAVPLYGAEPTAGTAVPMPDVLYQEGYEHPTWVSATSALDGGGEIATSLFRSDALSIVDELKTRPEEAGCVRWRPSLEVTSSAEESVGPLDHLQRAFGVVRGRVTGVSGGFLVGEPGTLVRFVPTRSLAGHELAGEQFIFLPVGRFRFADRWICVDDPEYPEAPSRGAELIVAVPEHWDFDSDPFLVGGSWNYFPLGEAGRLTVHRSIAEHLPETARRADGGFEAWLEEIRSPRRPQ